MKQAFYADYIHFGSVLHKNSWLLVENEKITGISDVSPEVDGYKVTAFNNSAIFPGMINTHTHLGMSFFRGMADDLPLMTWLSDHIWPAEKKAVNYEFVYDATLLSIAESLHSGVTCLNDMYFFPEAVTMAMREAGVRGVAGFPIIGDIQKAFKFIDEFEECELVKASVAPHALYTAGPDKIKACVDLACKKDMLVHTHLAETLDENKGIMEKYGKSPAMLMNDTGIFDCKSIFAHCVHLDDADIRLLGDKKVAISHCLESNLKLASGFAPVIKLMDAGALVAIGTDGAASNNDQSIISEMSTVSKFHKAFNMDATAMPARLTFDMATKNGAAALRYDKIGELKQGNFADFFVISFDAARMTPVYDPVSHLVYAAENNDVTDVFIAGRQIMSDRKILTFDEETVKMKARNIMKLI